MRMAADTFRMDEYQVLSSTNWGEIGEENKKDSKLRRQEPGGDRILANSGMVRGIPRN